MKNLLDKELNSPDDHQHPHRGKNFWTLANFGKRGEVSDDSGWGKPYAS